MVSKGMDNSSEKSTFLICIPQSLGLLIKLLFNPLPKLLVKEDNSRNAQITTHGMLELACGHSLIVLGAEIEAIKQLPIPICEIARIFS